MGGGEQKLMGENENTQQDNSFKSKDMIANARDIWLKMRFTYE